MSGRWCTCVGVVLVVLAGTCSLAEAVVRHGDGDAAIAVGRRPYECIVGRCQENASWCSGISGTGDVAALSGIMAGVLFSVSILMLHGAVACFIMATRRKRDR
jgi:hypothetical protein